MEKKEAIRILKDFHDNSASFSVKIALETLTPELKESEDEELRKQVFYAIKQLHVSDCTKNKLIDWLEKQGEQKPTDKVKSKFGIGDWVVKNYRNSDTFIQKVVGVKRFNEEVYGYELDDGTYFSGIFEKEYHLWTIQDAKDGDVIVNGSNIFIFSNLSSTRVMGYCHINLDDGKFYDDKGKNECFGLIDTVFTPTTKEQCDLLFQKMKEAGYEWDADKKELKKIKQE